MRASGGVLMAVAASLAMANAAYAGTVEYASQPPDHLTPAGTSITYNDGLGETNNVTMLQGPSSADPVTIRDSGALVLPAVSPFAPLGLVETLRYCTFNLTSATCRTWAPQVGIGNTLYLGAGNDRAYVDTAGALIDGGSGNDHLTATRHANFRGGSGADFMSGGSGSNDSVSYFVYSVGVNVSLDGVANDGTPGEGDNAMPTIENITGTDHDDHIVGSDAANFLVSEFGAGDVVEGLGGDDRLWVRRGIGRGGDGADSMHGEMGARMYGEDGNDHIFGTGLALYDGGGGDDRLRLDGGGPAGAVIGGDGNDTVRLHIQQVSVDLGAGDDSVTRPSAATNKPVTVSCGDGNDTVQLTVGDSAAPDCENVTII